LTTSWNPYPAFRSVSARCVSAKKSQGVRLSEADDIIYSPDQPDYDFRHGLTIAAWIKPDRVTGVQSIARKRLDETSAFAMVIDGNQLRFIVRNENGGLSNVSAPIKAGMFSYVVGTFDTTKIQLYVNGKVVASAPALGEMARGVGPIFVGNDASGRLFKGVVDDVLVSNMAATLDDLKGFACASVPLVAEISPASGPAVEPETPVDYVYRFSNPNDPLLCRGTYVYGWLSLPSPIYSLNNYDFYDFIDAGQQKTIPLTLAAYDYPNSAGAYEFSLNSTSFSVSCSFSATATFNLLPSRCLRQPATVSITPSRQVGTDPYVPMPFVMNVTNTNSPEFCRTNTFNTVTTIPYYFGTDLNYSYQIAPGETLDIPFNVTNWAWYGTPLGPVSFQVGVTETYTSTQTTAPLTLDYPLRFNFDSSTDGFAFSTWFSGSPGDIINLAGNPPPGAVPPELSFDSENGDPNPGSLKVTIPFTDWNQHVDTVIEFPWPFSELDLTGKTLHAKVRLVSGPQLRGGIQIHASSLPDWVWAGGTWISNETLVQGEWVPLSLDLSHPRNTPTGTFDPSRIVQIGVQVLNGSVISEPYIANEPTVIEIDSVND
jgi:hypothetical protein